jgi:hypothetical protein
MGKGRPMLGFRFNRRFKPPVDDKDKVRLLAPVQEDSYAGFDGSLVPFFDYIEHFNSTIKRGHICSKIWKEESDGELSGNGKCLSCKCIDDGAKNTSQRRLSAFLLLHHGWYYNVPVEKDGKILTYQVDSKFHKKGDTIYNRLRAEEVIDKYGRREVKREGWEKVYGNLLHWSLGTNHLLGLGSAIQDIEKNCVCGGSLTEVIWECEHCERDIIDTTDGDFDMTKKELNAITSKDYKCRECGEVGLLQAVIDCDECDDPEPVQIWDVDFEVGRVGEGPSSQLSIGKFERCELPDTLKSLIPEKDFLHRVFAGDSLEYQSKILRIPNPWKGEADEHSEEYDNKDKDDKGDKNEDVDDIPF